MTEAIEAQIERYAPGFGGRVLARHTRDTSEYETYNPKHRRRRHRRWCVRDSWHDPAQTPTRIGLVPVCTCARLQPLQVREFTACVAITRPGRAARH